MLESTVTISVQRHELWKKCKRSRRSKAVQDRTWNQEPVNAKAVLLDCQELPSVTCCAITSGVGNPAISSPISTGATPRSHVR
jgi:hypothetical protein